MRYRIALYAAELDTDWIEDYATEGVILFEALLAKHAAFLDYCDGRGGDNGR